MIKEVFVPVRDYEGIYEISNYGNVRSLERVVMRSDGIARRVSAKNLVSFKGTCLARDGEKKPTSKPVLTIAAFYPEYNIKRHKLIPKNVDQDGPILNRYTFHVKPRLNPVTIRTPDGGTIRYNNYMELCKDYKICEDTFLEYFYTGNVLHNQDLNGCTIAFDHPFYINGEYKIISHLVDARKATYKINNK